MNLPLVDHSLCQKLLKKTRLGKWFRLHESFICAGGEPKQDTCQGDGGGPLACLNEATKQWELVGITSWGIGCGENIPAVYANVAWASDWFRSILDQNYGVPAQTYDTVQQTQGHPQQTQGHPQQSQTSVQSHIGQIPQDVSGYGSYGRK